LNRRTEQTTIHPASDPLRRKGTPCVNARQDIPMDKREADSPARPNDTRPHPPRYWWLKRILLTTGVLLLGMLVLRWWWGWYADRQLQAKINELRAAGQRVTIEDFQYAPVPDEENAAHFLMKAHAAIVTLADVRIPFEAFAEEPALAAEHPDELRRTVEPNAEVLRLVRVARSKPRTDWGIRMTSPVWNMSFSHLSTQRQLARLCCAAALHYHQSRDDRAVVECLRDALDLTHRLAEPPAEVLTNVSRQGTARFALRTLEEITPELRVAGAGLRASALRQPAERNSVQALIDELLNERATREAWRSAIRGDRLMYLDGLELAATGRSQSGTATPVHALFACLFRPMYRLDAVRIVDAARVLEEVGMASDWPTASSMLPPFPDLKSGTEQFARPISSWFAGLHERAAMWCFLEFAERRMAATALAIRLYELDHGQRPQRLEDLVPDYLPTVPADPCTADGRALGYRLHGPQPLLYGVGKDGVDEGGEFALDNDGDVDWEAKDIPFFLNGDRPRPERNPWIEADPNSPQAVDDDRQVEGDERERDQDKASRDDP